MTTVCLFFFVIGRALTRLDYFLNTTCESMHDLAHRTLCKHVNDANLLDDVVVKWTTTLEQTTA